MPLTNDQIALLQEGDALFTDSSKTKSVVVKKIRGDKVVDTDGVSHDIGSLTMPAKEDLRQFKVDVDFAARVTRTAIVPAISAEHAQATLLTNPVSGQTVEEVTEVLELDGDEPTIRREASLLSAPVSAFEVALHRMQKCAEIAEEAAGLTRGGRTLKTLRAFGQAKEFSDIVKRLAAESARTQPEFPEAQIAANLRIALDSISQVPAALSEHYPELAAELAKAIAQADEAVTVAEKRLMPEKIRQEDFSFDLNIAAAYQALARNIIRAAEYAEADEDGRVASTPNDEFHEGAIANLGQMLTTIPADLRQSHEKIHKLAVALRDSGEIEEVKRLLPEATEAAKIFDPAKLAARVIMAKFIPPVRTTAKRKDNGMSV